MLSTFWRSDRFNELTRSARKEYPAVATNSVTYRSTDNRFGNLPVECIGAATCNQLFATRIDVQSN